MLSVTVLVSVVNFPKLADQRPFSDDAVLRLVFDDSKTEGRWQVRSNSLSYVMTSRHIEPAEDAQVLELVSDISSITGIAFDELALEQAPQANVVLFAEYYRDAHEFELWQTTVSELYNLTGPNHDMERFMDLRNGLATSVAMAQSIVSGDEPGSFKPHLHEGEPFCWSAFRFFAGAENHAVSAFGQMDMPFDQPAKQHCFLRAFLSAVGLRGVRRFATEDLIEENRGDEVHLSSLARCALEVLYHPIMETRRTLESGSIDKARRILADHEVCR
ncbi:MAG: hypothetical protein ACFB0Z_00490 [Candidatus Phaeomarinobacter sp.]